MYNLHMKIKLTRYVFISILFNKNIKSGSNNILKFLFFKNRFFYVHILDIF